ncbi:MAG: signal peptidase I [Boseongicola sp.]|nr:signal peptidase I [Boseongicola sp.]MDD9977112.1 signal peptidase I [Boseongicola sp.]
MTDQDSSFTGGIVETIKTIVYALLIAGIFRTLFFQPFWIPSSSMKDTLLIGDFLFVNKMAYGYSSYSCVIPVVQVSVCPFIGERWMGGEPERGDVVVFAHPVTKQDFIKRVVGLPGDTVQMVDGRLVINGTPVPQVDDGVFTEVFDRQGPIGSTPLCREGRRLPQGADCTKEKLLETLPNGVQHSVLNVRESSVDNTGVFRVPEGQYFFVGDNRDNSTDSRVPQLQGGVGLVPYENLIGRADRVMFSSAGRSLFFVWTWRGDRFFKKIE